MNKPTSNLPEIIAAGETISGVQICPFGEYANGKTMQVCDETAFGQIAGNTSGEVLCDFEHKSEDPSPTSDTAAAAVSSRRLRFLSPSMNQDRPVHLT